MSDEEARQGLPDTNTITGSDDSNRGGERWRSDTPSIPQLVISVEFEGSVRMSIHNLHGDERQATSLRAWIASDPDLAELCEIARRIRDRRDAR